MGKTQIDDIVQRLVGMRSWQVEKGIGTFITMDFGKKITTVLNTTRGERRITRGEWHFWSYMCAWRIDKDGKPYVGCEDEFEIEEYVKIMESKRINRFSILSNAFDARIDFEDNISFHLFSHATNEEQWMLFTPGDMVLNAGPSDKWSYKSSNEP